MDADLGSSSGTGSSTSNLLPSGTAIAGTTSTARQNTTNSLNGMPYSQRYHTLYRKRITLPVFEYRADFMRLLAENQCIVLVGEVSILLLCLKFCLTFVRSFVNFKPKSSVNFRRAAVKQLKSPSGVSNMHAQSVQRVFHVRNHVEWPQCLSPNVYLKRWM